MAGRFEYALASQDDDAALRGLLRQIAMPGDITLAFLREPSYFVAEQAGCVSSQVLLCRDRQQDGRIVGMASRSVRNVYIDGSPTHVGYLGMLRGVPESRGNIGLARGYQYLKRLHADGSIPYYFTTILDENAAAMDLLTSARGSLPIYHPFAHLVTYLIPLTGRRRATRSGESVTRVRREQLDEAIAHLNECNSSHQFARSIRCWISWVRHRSSPHSPGRICISVVMGQRVRYGARWRCGIRSRLSRRS